MKKKNSLMSCVVAIGMAAAMSGPPSASAAVGDKAPVVEVQTYGTTYGELSARWWQWVLSLPAAVNPQLDPTGNNCAQGQYDDVWFLAANFGGTATRTCTVPAGKPIFFPLVNTVVFKPYGYETLLDLRKQAAAFIDTVDALSASLDGVAIANLAKYRVRSPAFTVIAPAGGLLPPGWTSVPGNTDTIVSDGYWLLLPPLKPGTHVLHFSSSAVGLSIDVTYTLVVQ